MTKVIGLVSKPIIPPNPLIADAIPLTAEIALPTPETIPPIAEVNLPTTSATPPKAIAPATIPAIPCTTFGCSCANCCTLPNQSVNFFAASWIAGASAAPIALPVSDNSDLRDCIVNFSVSDWVLNSSCNAVPLLNSSFAILIYFCKSLISLPVPSAAAINTCIILTCSVPLNPNSSRVATTEPPPSSILFKPCRNASVAPVASVLYSWIKASALIPATSAKPCTAALPWLQAELNTPWNLVKLLPASSADIPPLIIVVDHALISAADIPTEELIPPILLFTSIISVASAAELFSNPAIQEPRLLALSIDNPVTLPNLAIEAAASSADTPSNATCIWDATFVTSDKSFTPLTP